MPAYWRAATQHHNDPNHHKHEYDWYNDCKHKTQVLRVRMGWGYGTAILGNNVQENAVAGVQICQKKWGKGGGGEKNTEVRVQIYKEKENKREEREEKGTHGIPKVRHSCSDDIFIIKGERYWLCKTI